MSTKIMHILTKCPNLRILLLDRPHVIQEHSKNPDFGSIDITSAMLDQDIEAFINNEIAKSDILSLPEFRMNVYETLKDKSDGMFLWVRLMVDDLSKSSSKFEFNERLEDLPCGLEKAYQLLFLRVSQKLDKFELRLAQNILALISVSCRPLHFEELRYALALLYRSLETVPQPLEEYLLLQPHQRVLDVTGSLIAIRDGSLGLVHSSVRVFLIRPEGRWVCEPDRAVLGFRIDITQTHRSFAWLCLDYLRLEKEEEKNLKPDTFDSMQTLWENYPLLGYATVYAFYHLNRSGPPCSITLAKIENVLNSTQSVLWVEYFAHLLFEDLTLASQVDESTALQDWMADAGLDIRFFAIIEQTLEELIGQKSKAEKNDIPYTEQVGMFLDIARDDQFGTSSQNQSNKATDSVPESSTAGFDLQTLFSKSGPSSNGPSTTVSRMMDLLKPQTSLPIAHQVELYLRLASSLRKTRVLIDPLKVLFQLILRKASSIHVFALVEIGNFYRKLEKFQEALEVYTAASKKMDHLDIPLKFRIHRWISYCYRDLYLYMEALRSYEKAFSGLEILLGRRHFETLYLLKNMIHLHICLQHFTEVLRLCDKICMEQDFVPELRIVDNLDIQGWRSAAYRSVGDHDSKELVRKSLRVTLKKYRESLSKDNGETAAVLSRIGRTYYAVREYGTALECFQLAFKTHKESKGPNCINILKIQRWIASTYEHLRRYSEARESYMTLYAEAQSVCGPDHRITLLTRMDMDTHPFDDSHGYFSIG
ncbi:hypothetical protein MMC28_006072 [Mycoblastus sanguinarius]|nr:hypothetical protein [Mycoblastus sanguinarius]